MSTVAEIEQAIDGLTPEKYAELIAWLDERRAMEVDVQFEAAILAGKFDTLAAEALRDIDSGETIPLEDLLRERR